MTERAFDGIKRLLHEPTDAHTVSTETLLQFITEMADLQAECIRKQQGVIHNRIAARLWQQQAEALYEECVQAMRTLDPEGPGLSFDKIQMIASITRLVEQELDAVMHLKDKT